MQKHKWHIREATANDFKEVFDAPLENSARAWVLDMAGKICGIGGVILVGGAYTVFLKTKVGLDIPKSIIVKAMKEGWEKISQMNFVALYAIKDPSLESAERLLQKFGFKDDEKSIDEGRVYIWQAR